MRRRVTIGGRVGALLCATALLAIAAVPSPPSAREARPAGPVGDADVRLTAGADGLRPEGRTRDFLEHVRAAAAEGRPFTVAETFAVHAIRLGLPVLEHPEEPPVEEGPVGTDVYAVPTGDIDGDGRGDLYALVYRADGGAHVEARRGVDGAVLWTLAAGEATDLLPVPVGDLDGDGTTDLLLWAFAGTEDVTEDCDDDGCRFTYDASGVWRYGIASGAGGAARWVREVPMQLSGTYEERSSQLGYEYSVTVSGTNPFLAPWVAGDLDGDGRADLAVELVEAVDIDMRWRTTGDPLWLAGRDEASFTGDLTTSLTTVGTDGADRHTLARGDGLAVGGFADLDGDGTDDVHLVEYTLPAERYDCVTAYVVGESLCLADERTPASEALVVVAGGGGELWRTDMGEAYLWVWDVPDVDGDGGADLVVNDLISSGSGVWSGRNGEVRWWLDGDPAAFSVALPGGDLDADGVVDVVRVVDGGDPDAHEISITIERYAGADGTAGATTRYAEPYDPNSEWIFSSVGVWLEGEVDGLPGADLAVEVSVTDDRGTRGGTTFERGADGTAVDRLAAEHGSIVALEDLTGDGTDDVVTVTGVAMIEVCEIHEDGTETCESHGDGSEPAVSARQLPDLAPLWQHAMTAEGGWRWLSPVGDLDGAPGSEVLEQVFLMEPDADGFLSGFVVRDGLDLTARWRLGATAPR